MKICPGTRRPTPGCSHSLANNPSNCVVPADPDSRPLSSSAIKVEALRLGFDACGVSQAEYLDAEARKLEMWLNQGRHASMSWMASNFDKRVDPRKLVEGARSVISVLCNYFTPVELSDDPDVGRISRYALGDDYHDVLKSKLGALFDFIGSYAPDVAGRDSGLEQAKGPGGHGVVKIEGMTIGR